MTGDKTCVCCYDVETNGPYGSCQKNLDRKKHAKFVRMLRFASTANKEYCIEILRSLREAIREKCAEF